MFAVDSVRAGAVLRVVPVGELDIATVPRLTAAFDAAFADEAQKIVVSSPPR
jgi:hypothetical protein